MKAIFELSKASNGRFMYAMRSYVLGLAVLVAITLPAAAQTGGGVRSVRASRARVRAGIGAGERARPSPQPRHRRAQADPEPLQRSREHPQLVGAHHGDRLVELKVFNSISKSSVQRALKKTTSSPGR